MVAITEGAAITMAVASTMAYYGGGDYGPTIVV
jgi:hypothetical protein